MGKILYLHQDSKEKGKLDISRIKRIFLEEGEGDKSQFGYIDSHYQIFSFHLNTMESLIRELQLESSWMIVKQY